jgi:phosphoribosylaminoimidazole carboxylase PurE protein
MYSVSIILGSDSDVEIYRKVAQVLEDFGVPFDRRILSAHRTPDDLRDYVARAEREGTRVFIAAAGMSAALPGTVAAHTLRPVIGVPVASSSPLRGFDSLLSVVQMPPGIPVAAVAVNGGANAGLLAVQILALTDPSLQEKLAAFRAKQRDKVLARDGEFREKGGA